MKISGICGLKKAWPSYTLAILYTLLIFLTIPYVRPIQKYVYSNLGKSAFGYFVLIILGVGFIGTFFYLKHSSGRKISKQNYLWLFLVFSLYGYFTITLWKAPEEAIHFIEYGLLSYLVYRALRYHIKDVTIFFVVSLIIFIIGTIDEIIQWLVPSRYWDFRDVWLNFLAGGLFQICLWKGIQPDAISKRVTPGSIRILLITAAGCLILLGICASNTPDRVLNYSTKIPFLSFIGNNEIMMNEYGHRLSDKEIGIFYSRFTKEELRSTDNLKKLHYSNILNAAQAKDYSQFIKAHNPLAAPFLYEMRSHIFQRDKFLALAEKETGKIDLDKENLTSAFKENLILERYYGETLRHSAYLWSVAEVEKYKKIVDLNLPYESSVSSELFTTFTERELWIGIGVFLTLLIAINVFFRRLPILDTKCKIC